MDVVCAVGYCPFATERKRRDRIIARVYNRGVYVSLSLPIISSLKKKKPIDEKCPARLPRPNFKVSNTRVIMRRWLYKVISRTHLASRYFLKLQERKNANSVKLVRKKEGRGKKNKQTSRQKINSIPPEVIKNVNLRNALSPFSP